MESLTQPCGSACRKVLYIGIVEAPNCFLCGCSRNLERASGCLWITETLLQGFGAGRHLGRGRRRRQGELRGQGAREVLASLIGGRILCGEAWVPIRDALTAGSEDAVGAFGADAGDAQAGRAVGAVAFFRPGAQVKGDQDCQGSTSRQSVKSSVRLLTAARPGQNLAGHLLQFVQRVIDLKYQPRLWHDNGNIFGDGCRVSLWQRLQTDVASPPCVSEG